MSRIRVAGLLQRLVPCSAEVRVRLERQLARRAKEMGYELKKVEAPPPEPASGG